MKSAYNRKKDPEGVRRAILDCAGKLAVQNGLGGLTVKAVAEEAGVTKGGLFHHFPSKQVLIEAAFTDLLEKFDAEVDAYIEKDPKVKGAFTRAYIMAVLDDLELGSDSPWLTMAMSMVSDPNLRDRWSGWLNARLERHQESDDTLTFDIARLAADGLWLSYYFDVRKTAGTKLDDLRRRLLSLAE